MLTTDELIKSYEGYYLLVGKNGSGKSSMLNFLSEDIYERGLDTITVSNTLFDKFKLHPKSQNYSYIGNRIGRYFPQQAIKNSLSSNNEIVMNKFFSVLDYLGYDQLLGIRINFKKKFINSTRYGRDAKGNAYPIYYDYSDEVIDDELKFSIDRAINESVRTRGGILWLESESSSFSEGFFSDFYKLIQSEKLLKRAGFISGIDIYLGKNGRQFPVNHASSGELSFIALLLHLALNLRGKSYLFIDEPENSLHPKWQSDYFSLLRGAIGYNECTVVIATHSPLIISSMISNNNVSVYKRLNSDFVKMHDNDANAEEVYLNYFDTLTPKNRALSNRCVDILDDFTEGKIGKELAKSRIEYYKNLTEDEAQQEFLFGVTTLIDDISFNKKESS